MGCQPAAKSIIGCCSGSLLSTHFGGCPLGPCNCMNTAVRTVFEYLPLGLQRSRSQLVPATADRAVAEDGRAGLLRRVYRQPLQHATVRASPRRIALARAAGQAHAIQAALLRAGGGCARRHGHGDDPHRRQQHHYRRVGHSLGRGSHFCGESECPVLNDNTQKLQNLCRAHDPCCWCGGGQPNRGSAHTLGVLYIRKSQFRIPAANLR
jgi:hypothetical protein